MKKWNPCMALTITAVFAVVAAVVPYGPADGANRGDDVLKKLMDGNGRFVAGTPAQKNVGKERRAELTGGQHPVATIVTCSDSRVPPEHIFDQGLGDIFIIRVAGNVVDDIALGSIE